MVRRLATLLSRAALALTTALSLALVACGGGSDATAPDPNPNPGQHEPTPQPQPQPQPEPQPQPDAGLPGSYGLILINNESKPGQLALLSDPDGTVIGLYRFDGSSSLTLNADHSYQLTMRLTDDKNTYLLLDEGHYQATPDGDRLSLTFMSAKTGGIYPGAGNAQGVAIKYDIGGDGIPDTVLGFVRIGG